MDSKKIRWLAISFLVTIVIIASWRFFFNSSAANQVSPKIGDVEEAVFGLGLVKAKNVFDFRPSLTYQIRKLYVTEGDLVRQGDLLLDLELGPQVRTPINGVVTRLPFREKENVFPQMSVIRVEDLSARFIEVVVEQAAAMRIRSQMKAQLSFESNRNQNYLATVESIYPSDSQFLVRLLPQHDLPPQILPGMTVDVVIQVGRKEKVTLIPISSVVQGKVTRIRDGKKEKIDVVTGLRNQTWIEVVKGDLVESDYILVSKEVKP